MSSQGSKEDAILVSRVKAGKLDAFWRLVTKYKQPINDYCHRMLLDKQAADNAAGDTFIKAFDNIHQLKENHKFRGWLYRIARNRCLDEIKEEEKIIDTPVEELSIISPGASPEIMVIDGERGKVVEGEVSKLPPNDKEIVILIHYERLSYEEAAEVLNIPVNTAKVRMHRIIGRLRKSLKGYVFSSLFCVGDIKDSASLAVKLRDARDPISRYLREQFSVDTQRLLDEYYEHGHPSESLQKGLVNELNWLLKGPCLFEKKRFAQVALTKETQSLIKQNPQGKDLIYLNRLLLEQAYPREIEKREDFKGLI